MNSDLKKPSARALVLVSAAIAAALTAITSSSFFLASRKRIAWQEVHICSSRSSVLTQYFLFDHALRSDLQIKAMMFPFFRIEQLCRIRVISGYK